MFQALPPCGIDFLLKNEGLLENLSQKKIGLLTHQNALTQNYKPSAFVLRERLGEALRCILTPEHGWSGFIPDGIEIDHGFDSELKCPLFSLYGGDKKYLDFMRDENIEALLIDLQDVGLRCYTYVATCAQLLEACAGTSLEIIICDRPNPLGSSSKGPQLEPRYRSLVGYLNVPFQHGQTMGELLTTYNQSLGEKKLPLTVIPCQRFHQPFHYPWIPPSPHLPSWEAVLLYPALVLLEGTTISEGRGTSIPFTSLGAPGLDHLSLVNFLNEIEKSGIRARPLTFTPTSSKFKGQDCQGAHLLLTDPAQLDAFSLGIKIISFLKDHSPGFEWTPMENKKDAYFIDYLLGTSSFRKILDKMH